ncbi:sulfotransferase [Ruegeria sp. HKCCD7221]|uniref:sulfotransferase family protein n=1 Tax=Ruegeria sp. HKCCD7221 TaxID=2683009 RepID=UPI001489A7C2|nr:sulfotransferase [Ruegeria sp. HKCCD7221]
MTDTFLVSSVEDKREEKTRKYRKLIRKLRRRDAFRLWKYTPGGVPGLIVIGAQKSGTTTLHQMLSQHPELWGHPRKELHYFNENMFRGEKWYRSFFPPQGARTYFDVTPAYLCHPYAAERMAALLPTAKLVVLLREPASRALSQYWMEYMRGEEDLDIEAAFAAEPDRLANYPVARLRRKRAFSRAHFQHGYFWRGLYEKQLERYYKNFDPAQILILKSEDLNTDPMRVFENICDFTGVAPFAPDILRINQSLVGNVIRSSPPALYQALLQRYEEPNARLSDLTGISWS